MEGCRALGLSLDKAIEVAEEAVREVRKESEERSGAGLNERDRWILCADSWGASVVLEEMGVSDEELNDARAKNYTSKDRE